MEIPEAARAALHAALPAPEGGVAPVLPDILGEAALILAWGEREGGLSALRRVAAEHRAIATKVVVRACQDFLVRGRSAPLSWLQALRADSTEFEALLALANAMPASTIELREIALELSQAVADLTRSLPEKADEAGAALRGAALNNLSIVELPSAGARRRWRLPSLLGHRQQTLAQFGEEVGRAVAESFAGGRRAQQRRFGHGRRREPGQCPRVAVNAEHACPLASVRSPFIWRVSPSCGTRLVACKTALPRGLRAPQHSGNVTTNDARAVHHQVAGEHPQRSGSLQRTLPEPVRVAGRSEPNSGATGATYAFEKGVTKAAGGGGWADVWRRGCFGWEYKSRGADLNKAHDQLLRYAGALENPPLLVSSDMDRIVVRTNWTNVVSETSEFRLEDLRDAAVRQRLAAMWTEPDRWRPGTTRQALTEKAAGEFAGLANRLRARGHDPQAVAHFVIRLVFCLFADDVALLPQGCSSGCWARLRRAQPASKTTRAAYSARWRSVAERSISRRSSGSTAGCSTTSGVAARAADVESWSAPPAWTGRRSTPRSSAPCSSAASIPTSAANSARTTPTATRSCGWSSPCGPALGAEWEAVKGEVAALVAKAEAAKAASARTKARD